MMFLLGSNEASHLLKIHGTNNIHDSYSFRVIEASYIPSQCGNLQFRFALRVIKAHNGSIHYIMNKNS